MYGLPDGNVGTPATVSRLAFHTPDLGRCLLPSDLLTQLECVHPAPCNALISFGFNKSVGSIIAEDMGLFCIICPNSTPYKVPEGANRFKVFPSLNCYTTRESSLHQFFSITK